jgi:hypothetical protein
MGFRAREKKKARTGYVSDADGSRNESNERGDESETESETCDACERHAAGAWQRDMVHFAYTHTHTHTCTWPPRVMIPGLLLFLPGVRDGARYLNVRKGPSPKTVAYYHRGLPVLRSEREGWDGDVSAFVGRAQRSRSWTMCTMWHRQHEGRNHPSIHPSITPLNTNAPMRASASRPRSCRRAHMSLRHTFSAEDSRCVSGAVTPVRGPCMSHLLNDTPTYTPTMCGDIRKSWCELGYTRMEPQTCEMEAEKVSKVHECHRLHTMGTNN